MGPYVGELGPKDAQKLAISWMLHRHEIIFNFTTTNDIKMKLTTIVHLHETFDLV